MSFLPPSPRSRSAAEASQGVYQGSKGKAGVTTGPVRQTLWFLAVPVLAEQLLSTLVGLFDVYLAGRISPAATSAVGLSAYVSWLVSMIVMLVGTGTTALVSRYEGANDHGEANHFANQSLTLAALCGVGLAATMFLLAPSFAWYCRMTGDTYDITVQYLRIEAIAHTMLSVTLVGCAALRGAGNMKTPMAIFAAMNVVNIGASLWLVYGWGPVPALGVNGIVGGTLVARFFGVGMMAVVLIRGARGVKLVANQLPLAWDRARRILRIGIPAAADGAIMWTGHFVFLSIISHLGSPAMRDVYFSAHVIAVRVEAFTYLPAVAWGAATATMIGQALGAEDIKRAIRVGHEGVLQCGLLSLLITVLFFFGASFIYRQMSADILVQAAGIRPFRILAILQPLLVISIVYISALRGAGDTRFPMLITIFGAIVLRIPLGYCFGIVLDGGLLGAWVGMFADMIWRATAASCRYVGGAWVNTRV